MSRWEHCRDLVKNVLLGVGLLLPLLPWSVFLLHTVCKTEPVMEVAERKERRFRPLSKAPYCCQVQTVVLLLSCQELGLRVLYRMLLESVEFGDDLFVSH